MNQTLIEKHYTINELKDRLNMSFERTRQLIKDEPGVLRFVSAATTKKPAARSKVMYRIPESVVQRILRRNANPAAA